MNKKLKKISYGSLSALMVAPQIMAPLNVLANEVTPEAYLEYVTVQNEYISEYISFENVTVDEYENTEEVYEYKSEYIEKVEADSGIEIVDSETVYGYFDEKVDFVEVDKEAEVTEGSTFSEFPSAPQADFDFANPERITAVRTVEVATWAEMVNAFTTHNSANGVPVGTTLELVLTANITVNNTTRAINFGSTGGLIVRSDNTRRTLNWNRSDITDNIPTNESLIHVTGQSWLHVENINVSTGGDNGRAVFRVIPAPNIPHDESRTSVVRNTTLAGGTGNLIHAEALNNNQFGPHHLLVENVNRNNGQNGQIVVTVANRPLQSIRLDNITLGNRNVGGLAGIPPRNHTSAEMALHARNIHVSNLTSTNANAHTIFTLGAFDSMTEAQFNSLYGGVPPQILMENISIIGRGRMSPQITSSAPAININPIANVRFEGLYIGTPYANTNATGLTAITTNGGNLTLNNSVIHGHTAAAITRGGGGSAENWWRQGAGANPTIELTNSIINGNHMGISIGATVSNGTNIVLNNTQMNGNGQIPTASPLVGGGIVGFDGAQSSITIDRSSSVFGNRRQGPLQTPVANIDDAVGVNIASAPGLVGRHAINGWDIHFNTWPTEFADAVESEEIPEFITTADETPAIFQFNVNKEINTDGVITYEQITFGGKFEDNQVLILSDLLDIEDHELASLTSSLGEVHTDENGDTYFVVSADLLNAMRLFSLGDELNISDVTIDIDASFVRFDAPDEGDTDGVEDTPVDELPPADNENEADNEDAGNESDSDGNDGAPGQDGQDGADGNDGTPGQDGQDGADGNDGAPGQDGQDGTDGNDGAPGNDGQDGADGNDGTPGNDGQDGADGNDGASGNDGQDGADGNNGADGQDGSNGTDGNNGTDGQNGTDGLNGTDGSNGTDGTDGSNGADVNTDANADADTNVNDTDNDNVNENPQTGTLNVATNLIASGLSATGLAFLLRKKKK